VISEAAASRITSVSAPKQTETTQRWKLGLTREAWDALQMRVVELLEKAAS